MVLPIIIAGLGAAVAGIVGIVMAPILFFLGLIGFSAVGVVAGSLAAAIQASIGCVVAGSLFAIAQSIAMGGTVGIFALISAIGGAVVVVSGGVIAVFVSLLCLL